MAHYAKDLMARDVLTCHPDTSLAEIAELMWETDIGFIPVIDSETSELRGVLTDRDAYLAARRPGTPLSEIPASAATDENVICCVEDDELSFIHTTMRSNRIRRLPVLDAKGQLVGVISLDDLATAALEAQGAEAVREVGITLGEICRPEELSKT